MANKKRRRGNKGKDKGLSQSRTQGTMQRPGTGRPPALMGIAPSLEFFTLEPLRGTGRLYQSTQTLDLTTDEANIKTECIDKVLFNHLTKSGIDKYDSTLFGNAADVILDAATLITELRLIMQTVYYAPAFTRNDASAGSPFTRASLTGLILNMEATQELCIPGLSLALADYWTKVIQLDGASPNTGRLACYFRALKSKLQLSEVETLIGTLVTNHPGIVHLNRNRIPYFPFNRAMLQWEEHSIVSNWTMPMSKFITTADDAGIDVAEVDETREIWWFKHFGIGEAYEASALWRAQNTADSPKFLSTVANAAAGKVTVEYITYNGTSGTAVGDTSEGVDFIESVADGQSRTPKFSPTYAIFGTPIGKVDAGKLTVDGWNQRLVQYLTRHIDGAPCVVKGLPLLPDNVNIWGKSSALISPANSQPTPPSGGGNPPGNPPLGGKFLGANDLRATASSGYGQSGLLYDPASGQWYST